MKILFLYYLLPIFLINTLYSDFLKETLFGKTISYHNIFYVHQDITNIKLHPLSTFKKRQNYIEVSYLYDDILSIKENNRLTEYISQDIKSFFYTYPVKLLYNDGMFGVGYSDGKLKSILSSYGVPELYFTTSEYIMVLATKVKNKLSFGLSYIFYPTCLSGKIKIDNYPRSDNELENQYLYEPLEKYFGKEMYLIQEGNKNITVFEGKYNFNFKHSCSFQIKHSLSNEKFVLEHFNLDRDQLQHVDIAVNTNMTTFDIYSSHNLSNRLAIIPVLNFNNVELKSDFIPREAVPKKDVTDFGDLKIKTYGYGYGLATYFNLTDKLKIFASSVLSKDEYDIKCYFSTPVLGYEFFFPVVHRAYGDIKIYIPSIYYNLGIKTKFKLLNFDIVLNYHKFDFNLNISGKAAMMAGLISSSINKNWFLKNALQVFFLSSKTEVSLSKGIKVCYNFILSLPIISDEIEQLFKKEFGIEVQPPPPPVYVKKEVSGGMTHIISLNFAF